MGETYAQAGQDLFVLGLFKDTDQHYFVDIGCWLPDNINNTFLLEKNGWRGLSIDITDLKKEWGVRDTSFVATNALTADYKQLFDEHGLPQVIDYLSVDIEGNGDRCNALKKVFESGREFKVITIEHDRYRGYEEKEVIPQRKFLTENNYTLLCSDVCIRGINPFEDWWINPKFFDKDKYNHLFFSNADYITILNKQENGN